MAYTIIDDAAGSPGFVLTGSWLSAAYGYGNACKYTGSGTGTKKATWTFSSVTPGWYRIGAHWVHQTNRTQAAPYSVYDNTTLLDTVTLNQENAPSEWRPYFSEPLFDYLRGPGLGYYWRIESTTIKVELTDDVEDYVFADAICIEQLTYVRKQFHMGLGF